MDYSNKRALTFLEACEVADIKPSYGYKLTSSGIWRTSKPGGKKLYIDREFLEKWMLSNANSSREEKEIEAATFVTINQ